MSTGNRKYAFRGLMAPTYAPFSPDGSLNLSLVPRYAQLLNDSGVAGVYVNGTLGEGVSMTTSERMEVAEAWVKCRDMVGHVVVQVGGASLKDAQILAKHAESIGASAIASFPPMFDKPTSIDHLVDYCKQIAQAAPNTPFLYYHYPQKTGVDFAMDEFLEAAALEIPTMSGLKFTSLSVGTEGVRCLLVANGAMTILSGFEQTLTEARKLGFHGAINASFNFLGLDAGKLFCLAGMPKDSVCCGIPVEERQKEVQRLQARLDTPWQIMEEHGGGMLISAAKIVMKLLTGLDTGPARRPQLPLSPESVQAIRTALQNKGFLIKDSS